MNLNAFHKISYGLFVLTSSDGDKQNGCIINTLMQQTVTPALISVTVNKTNFTHELIVKSGKFNVSVIDTTASFDLFTHFGFSSGRETEKIKTYKNVAYAENGIAYISANTNAYFSAEVKSVVDLGTHSLFVAEVKDCEILSEYDSMTYAYYHKHVKPVPQETQVTGWRCKICGYVHSDENLPDDFVCPICKHGAADFEKIETEINNYDWDDKNKEIIVEHQASINQLPVKLAYASTIHKCQGMTFNNINLDLSYGAFAPGQLYVALSRATSLEGITLMRPIQPKDIILDGRIDLLINKNCEVM